MPHDESRHFLLWSGAITAFFVILFFVPIAVALLLPGVQFIRETWRRDQTRENLRELGMALANYHDQLDRLERNSLLSDAPADALRCENQIR